MQDGWGLATDGKVLFGSDGSSTLYLINPQTFKGLSCILHLVWIPFLPPPQKKKAKTSMCVFVFSICLVEVVPDIAHAASNLSEFRLLLAVNNQALSLLPFHGLFYSPKM